MRRAMLAAVGAATTLTLAACGTNTTTRGEPPTKALATGVTTWAGAATHTVTLRFDLTAAAARTLDRLDPGQKPITREQVQALTSGVLTLTIRRNGTPPVAKDPLAPTPAELLATLKSETLDASFEYGGQTAADVRLAGGSLYARADVDRLAGLSDDPAAARRAIAAARANKDLPGFVRKVIGPALDGQWVKIDGRDIAHALSAALSLLKEVAPQIADQQAKQSADERTLVTDIVHTLLTVPTVTRVGGSGVDDVLHVDIPVRTLVFALVSDVKRDLGSLPFIGSDGSAQDPIDGLSAMPDLHVPLDVTVREGALSAVHLDLTRFLGTDLQAKPRGATWGLALGFSTAPAEISEPAGATTMDISQLISEVERSGLA